MERADYDQLKRFQREKRAFDFLCIVTEGMVRAFRYFEEKGGTPTKRERTKATMSSWRSRKRQKMIDECENQDPKQKPNRVACSPSLCHVESKRRGQVRRRKAPVSNKKVRRRKAPVREREAVVQERGRTPEWLVNVMRENNGTDAKMIMKEKVLEESDVNKHKARLLIPWNEIVDVDFMNEEELEIVDKHHRKKTKKGLDFTLVGLKGQTWDLNLRRWDMTSTSNYVLVTGWNKVVFSPGNRLRKGQRLQIWSFRSPDKLYIALVTPEPAPALAMALAPAPDPATSSRPAPVVTRDSDELDLETRAPAVN
ncbi:PREDICTED: B3 domain-containing protein At2g31720-like [Camelina sativa]|uniref:B3 domain-containing protein At2g31720-like n=1 Tax=Camelina sativa TaxID=90675 RepID=A0ABM0Z429_CAMSA|nr:PREDICTED: B3 domain-containing protein At2g31720-like [Camelina sativa]